MATPTPDETWPLTGTYQFKGITATGQAWVFHGKGNNSVTNPVIIAEGFPGGQSLDALWTAFNRSNFASTLLSLGFDVIFLGYIAPTQNSPTYVEANAAVAIACVQKAIAAAPKANLAVGGASMGGLVTRYALAYMEQNKIPHNTSLYFSFDTPHLGASIPASVLYFVNFFAAQDPKDPDLQAIFNLLQSPAAQEMLLYWLAPYPGKGKPWQPAVSQLRTDFLKNLTALANKGFPAKPYLVGVSNGSGTGTGNTTAPSAKALAWSYKKIVQIDAELFAAPGLAAQPVNTSARAQIGSDVQIFSWNYNLSGTATQYDGAPGGRGDFFQTVANALQGKGTVTLNYGQSCFIPTISALAMSSLDPNKQPDLYRNLTTAPTPASSLQSYLYSATNDLHVTFTPQLSQWLLGQILAYGPQLANGLPG